MLSFLTLIFNSSLKRQFDFIKQTVVLSLEDKKQIPESLTNVLIQIEDRRFFQHKGIDIYSISRAFIKNTITNRLEGASTITQQLVRNITNEREIALKRKIKEIVLATLIDNYFSKNEILFAYVSTYRFMNCVGIFSFF
jgi:membrane peptidoglycan carboxypeptidase